jgi:hypothetical protein
VTNLVQSLTRSNPISFNDLLQSFQFGGLSYQLQMGGTPGQKSESIENSYLGYVQGAYKRNGIIFACMAARQLLFSEARFQFRQVRGGRPGTCSARRSSASSSVRGWAPRRGIC